MSTLNPYADRAAIQQQIAANNAAAASTTATTQPEVQQFVKDKQAAETGNPLAKMGMPNMFTSFKNPVENPHIPVQPTTTEKPAASKPQSTGNQQANQPIRSTDDLARAMGYTSPEDEDRMRKASLTNQRILAIGDAIRQLGNIYHAVNYAPSQELTNPVEIEQQRYLQGKALRDRANQTYLDYQQAKAKQDAQQRQWEEEQKYKREKDARDFGYRTAKDAADFKYKTEKDKRDFDFNKQKHADDQGWKQKSYDQKERQHRESQAVHWYNAATSRMNAETSRAKEARESGNGGRGSGVPLDTPYGKIRLSGKTHDADQIRQIWSYAKQLGLTSQSEIDKMLEQAGLGKDDTDSAMRRKVMDLMRTDGRISLYAANNLDAAFDDGYPQLVTPAPQQNNGLFSAPWNNGGRETLPGFGGGVGGSRQSSSGGGETIPGFRF